MKMFGLITSDDLIKVRHFFDSILTQLKLYGLSFILNLLMLKVSEKINYTQ